MAKFLKDGEALLQVGTMGLRGPDGDVVESVPLYKIISVDEVNPQSGLTEGEEDVCTEFAWRMRDKFKQYVDGVNSLKKKGEAPC